MGIDLHERYGIIDYMGSWNIGAFMRATNSFTIIGDGFRPQIIEKIESVLRVPVIVQKVYEEDLVGCLIVANSNGILTPPETLDTEINFLKKKTGVIVERLDLGRTYSNALGNIILANNSRAVIHSSIYHQNRKKMEIIEDVLDVEVIPFNTDLTEAIASYAVLNSRGLIVSPLFNTDEIEAMRKALKIPKEHTIISTVNMGNPIVGSGCIANDYGVIVGSRTTGIELARIYLSLIHI